MDWKAKLSAGVTRAAKPEDSEPHECMECGKPLNWQANYSVNRAEGRRGPVCNDCDGALAAPHCCRRLETAMKVRTTNGCARDGF